MRNKNKNRIFRFNRRTRQQTDYKKRLELLKGGFIRTVIRKSNNNINIAFVYYDIKGDKIITGAKSNALKKLGSTLHSGNLLSAYLTGYLAGKKFLKTNKEEVILDLGLQRKIYGSRIFSAVKGIVDAGVSVRVKEDVFPSNTRMKGGHLKTKDADKQVELVKKNIEMEVNKK
jgi:large subunit ribosomal protein L18